MTLALRLRGVDVRTAQEDYAALLNDDDLLRRSTQLGRLLVSQDDDLLRVAVGFQKAGTPFAGVVYAHQMRVSIGEMVEDLDLVGKASDSKDWVNRIEYLPLR